MQQLAIDIGATGIKGAIIDVEQGILVTDRIKYLTPKPALPRQVIKVVGQIVKDTNWQGDTIAIGFPAIIKNNICLSASNIDKSWININIKSLVQEVLGLNSVTINDADAAGVAEMTFGKGKGVKGTVIMLTLGSGIGSGVFKDGVLLPNFELGQLIYKKSVAEHYASNSARKKFDLTWDEYGLELNKFLQYIDRIFNPNLIIIGGGISKHYEKYAGQFDAKISVTAALTKNNAGIIGAAMYAIQQG